MSPAPHEIVAEFVRLTRPPTQAQLSALAARRIGLWALAGRPGTGEFGIGFARIARLDDGRFDFADDGVPGMCVIALDAFAKPADIVGWPLRAEWIAAWWGRVSMLGQQHVDGPRPDGALTIFCDPLAWLRGDREGLVLVDERRATRELRDSGPFRAADFGHGLRLQRCFTALLPSIVVPLSAEDRRAA